MLKRDFCILSLRRTMSVCYEFLPEDFRRCFVSQAFARRIVEAMTDEYEIAVSERQRIKVSGEPSSCSPVGVFDRSLLPGRLRITEPRL